MKKKMIAASLWMACVIAGLPATGHAQRATVCNEGFKEISEAGLIYLGDHFSASDGAYLAMLGGGAGCVENFDDVLYYNWAYRTPRSSWRGAGYHDACNVHQPYTRFWMAAHLLHRAVSPDNLPEGSTFIPLRPAFHDSRLDYGPLTEGLGRSICRGCSEERWHKGYETRFENTYELVGRWRKGVVLSDFPNSLGHKRHVALQCPTFDVIRPSNNGPQTTANLGVRAGVLVHEAWHARYESSQRLGKHRAHPGPFIPGSDPPEPDYDSAWCQFPECDSFIPRGKMTPAGEMYHVQMMPYQAELHFQCDILDSSKDWVPLAVMEDLEAENANVMEAFRSPPPYSCGVPEPLPGSGRRTLSCPAIGNDLGVACATRIECPPPPVGYDAAECRSGCCEYVVIR